MVRFYRSARWAVSGIIYALRTERNMRFHASMLVMVVAAGLGFGISGAEWIAVLLVSALVLAAELMNTAVENIVDLASPQRHPLAKAAKDTAAGAVLILGIAAVAVGLIVFVPYVRAWICG